MGLRKLLLSLALLPAFVVISAMAIIATSLNKDAAMNKRLEARREKAAETREAREAMKIGNVYLRPWRAHMRLRMPLQNIGKTAWSF